MIHELMPRCCSATMSGREPLGYKCLRCGRFEPMNYIQEKLVSEKGIAPLLLALAVVGSIAIVTWIVRHG